MNVVITFEKTLHNAVQDYSKLSLSSDLKLLNERLNMESYGYCGLNIRVKVDEDIAKLYVQELERRSSRDSEEIEDYVVCDGDEDCTTVMSSPAIVTRKTKDVRKTVSATEKEVTEAMDVAKTVSATEKEVTEAMDVAKTVSATEKEVTQAMDVAKTVSSRERVTRKTKDVAKTVSSPARVTRKKKEVGKTLSVTEKEVTEPTDVGKTVSVTEEEVTEPMDVAKTVSSPARVTRNTEDVGKTVSATEKEVTDPMDVAKTVSSPARVTRNTKDVGKTVSVTDKEVTEPMDVAKTVSSPARVTRNTKNVGKTVSATEKEVTEPMDVANTVSSPARVTRKTKDVGKEKSVTLNHVGQKSEEQEEEEEVDFTLTTAESKPIPAVTKLCGKRSKIGIIKKNAKKAKKSSPSPKKVSTKEVQPFSICQELSMPTQDWFEELDLGSSSSDFNTSMPNYMNYPVKDRVDEVMDTFNLKVDGKFFYKSLGDTVHSSYCSMDFFHMLAMSLDDVQCPVVIDTPVSMEINLGVKAKKLSKKSTRYIDETYYRMRSHFQDGEVFLEIGTMLEAAASTYGVAIHVYLEGEVEVEIFDKSPRAKHDKKIVHFIVLKADTMESLFVRLREGPSVETTIHDLHDVDYMTSTAEGDDDDVGLLDDVSQKSAGLAYHAKNVFFDDAQDNELVSFNNDFREYEDFTTCVNAKSMESPEMDLFNKIKNVLKTHDKSSQVAIKSAMHDRQGGHMKYSDLHSLAAPYEWLSNFTMDYYLNVLRNRFTTPTRSVGVFYTDFFQLLLKRRPKGKLKNKFDYYSHFNVYNYAVNHGMGNVLKCDFIITLVNDDGHWMVMVTMPKSARIVCLDSIVDTQKMKQRTARRKKYMNAFEMYLHDEYVKYSQGCLHGIKWEKVSWEPDMKQSQEDSFNCGVYALLYVETLLNGMIPNDVRRNWLRRYREMLLLTIVSSRKLYKLASFVHLASSHHP